MQWRFSEAVGRAGVQWTVTRIFLLFVRKKQKGGRGASLLHPPAAGSHSQSAEIK